MTEQNIKISQFTCPIPQNDYPNIVMAHGGGGQLTRKLITEIFYSAFGAPEKIPHDSFVFKSDSSQFAITTDSYVVRPAFFKGGDIGKLSIIGTANDLAMSGAKPLYITAGFILEEGFPIEYLWKVVTSMKSAADAVGVKIAAGDTKVVDKGKGDGIYITTAGIGEIVTKKPIQPEKIELGDAILINGDIGRHGMAIMSERENLEFDSDITSDCMHLWQIVDDLLKADIEIHCLRDLTRGGLAGALCEIAEDLNMQFRVSESKISVSQSVSASCEILGFDPLYVANEGRMVLFVKQEDAVKALNIMKNHPDGEFADIIGAVESKDEGIVILQTILGTNRIVQTLTGEQLPRIC